MKERVRVRKMGRESEREREREREVIELTGALAPLSYLDIYIICRIAI